MIFGFFFFYICNMIQQYEQSREVFLDRIKRLFPNSPNIQVDIVIDNISLEDFKSVPLPHKEQVLFSDFKYLTASPQNADETKIDEFKSELY